MAITNPEKLLSEYKTISTRLNKRLVDTQRAAENRFLDAIQGTLDDIGSQIELAVSRMTVGDDGRIETSPENLNQIYGRKKNLDRLVKSLVRGGSKIFIEGAIDIAELTTEEFNSWVEELKKGGMDVSQVIFGKAELQFVARSSVLLWADNTGSLADFVQTGLVRLVLGGATKEQLINEYVRIVPAIDKIAKNGRRWRMSAKTRALMTFRTETTKMSAQVMKSISNDAFGNDYLVQNSNPLDERTDVLLCQPATEAGLMPLLLLEAEYGLPGRHPNCRCVILTMPGVLARQL